MKLKQHPDLTPEKWGTFPFFKQILMVACELQRSRHWLEHGDLDEVKQCYERALELLDLTIELASGPTLLCELLRFRELLATEFISAEPSLAANRSLYRVLMAFTPESYTVRVSDPAEAA